MPFVLDAPVAACWLLPDERHRVAEAAYKRIAHDQAIAPALLWLELRNLLMVNERLGRLDSAKTARALRLLRALPIAIDSNVEEETVMQLARLHRLTVYDAVYLELALRKGLPLATLDAALSIAAKGTGVSLIGEGRK